jgi:methionine sulfoxide reductase heme-binding subunit
MNSRLLTALKTIVHMVGWIPLVVLIWKFLYGKLGANPISAIQSATGQIGIDLLFLSLTCTPIYLLSGFRPVLSLRRPLGLYAFMYISLHLINYIALDYGFNFTFIREDALFEKRFILVGLAGFLLLLPLAVFSIGRLRKKLGRKWEYLGWLTYGAAILGELHYLWQTKIDFRMPFIYGGILILLLVFRIPFVSKKLIKRFNHKANQVR